MGQWKGVCVACRQDLYADPARHYASRSHNEKVAALSRRLEKERKDAGVPDERVLGL